MPPRAVSQFSSAVTEFGGASRAGPSHLVYEIIEISVEPVEKQSEVVVIPHVRGTARFERRAVIGEAEHPVSRIEHFARQSAASSQNARTS